MKSRYYFALYLHTYHLRITNPEDESNSREGLGRVASSTNEPRTPIIGEAGKGDSRPELPFVPQNDYTLRQQRIGQSSQQCRTIPTPRATVHTGECGRFNGGQSLKRRTSVFRV